MTEYLEFGGLAADRLALDRAMVAEPVWNRLEPASKAVSLPRNLLLHAGPAFRPSQLLPFPVENSACVAAVFEGLADDFEEAARLIGDGSIRLAPAQDFGVVTPLATVVSASMQLHVVYDAHRGRVSACSPINGGRGPAPRFGLRSQSVVQHLQWLNGPFCEQLKVGIAEGIPLVPIAAASLAAGDDCHGRTPSATRILVDKIKERATPAVDDKARAFMASSPGFFLNLWMAGVKCILGAAEGTIGATLITAAGGNGLDFGVKLASNPDQWFTVRATPPVGTFDVEADSGQALGAIGDSAIIDVFGLGAMAFSVAPIQASAFRRLMPADTGSRRSRLYIGEHIAFEGLDLRFGLSAWEACQCALGPVISLGILDREGILGRLGGGIYEVPAEVFELAISAHERKHSEC